MTTTPLPLTLIAPRMATRAYLIPILFLVSFIPLLAYSAVRLWNRDAYQFFPAAWAAAGVLAYLRLRETPHAEHSIKNQKSKAEQPGAPVVENLLFLAAALLLAAATLSWTWSLGMLAFALAALALAAHHHKLRQIAPAVILFLTTLPPPFAWDYLLLSDLRAIAVSWSGRILDSIGILHVISGNLIEIPNHRLFVAEACSGLNSTLSSFAFAVGLSLFLRRNFFHTILLAALAVLFAIAANVLRISSGAALLSWYEIDTINGWKHEAAGLVIFAITLVLTLSADQLLACLFTSPGKILAAQRAPAPDKPIEHCALNSEHSRPLSRLLVAATIAALAVSLFGATAIAPRITWHFPTWGEGNLPAEAQFSLPEQITTPQGVWLKAPLPLDFNTETDSVKTQCWSYVLTNTENSEHGTKNLAPTRAIVALDYPFPGYHDLKYCYQAQGWTLTANTVAKDSTGPFESLTLARTGSNAQLFYTLFDEKSRWLTSNMERSIKANLIEHFLNPTGRPEIDPRPAYQIQLFSAQTRPPTPDEQAALAALYEQARTQLAGQIQSQLPH